MKPGSTTLRTIQAQTHRQVSKVGNTLLWTAWHASFQSFFSVYGHKVSHFCHRHLNCPCWFSGLLFVYFIHIPIMRRRRWVLCYRHEIGKLAWLILDLRMHLPPITQSPFYFHLRCGYTCYKACFCSRSSGSVVRAPE